MYMSSTRPCLLPYHKNVIKMLKDHNSEVEDVPEEETQIISEKQKKAIICSACGNLITYPEYKIAVNGKHAHVFFNPHGIVFELGCFSRASGCIPVGSSTLEFTWFEGYAWKIVVCSSCFEHMGWQYQGESGGGFFGLILPHLEEKDL